MINTLPKSLIDAARKIVEARNGAPVSGVAAPSAGEPKERQRFKQLYIAALKHFGVRKADELDDEKRQAFDDYVSADSEKEHIQISTLMGGEVSNISNSPIPWEVIYSPDSLREAEGDDDEEEDDEGSDEKDDDKDDKDKKDKLDVSIGGTYKYNSSSGPKSVTIIKERVPEGGYVAKDNSTGKKIIISLDNQYKIKSVNEEVQIDVIDERELTEAETKKKAEFVKSLELKIEEFEQNYGDKAMEVIHATATKMAQGI